MPDIPLYSNYYYDVYNAKIENFETSPFFDQDRATATARSKGMMEYTKNMIKERIISTTSIYAKRFIIYFPISHFPSCCGAGTGMGQPNPAAGCPIHCLAYSLEQLRRELGTDQNVFVRYLGWIGLGPINGKYNGILQGNFGNQPSLMANTQINTMATMKLGML